MGYVGYNSQNYDIGVVASQYYTYCNVYYYYTDGSYYRSEAPTVTKDGQLAYTKFDTYKMNSTGDRWVWAKNGYIQVDIAPINENGQLLNSVRAAGECGHATSAGTEYTVGVDVDLTTRKVSPYFTVTNGKGSVTNCGRWQVVFRNNGNHTPESTS